MLEVGEGFVKCQAGHFLRDTVLNVLEISLSTNDLEGLGNRRLLWFSQLLLYLASFDVRLGRGGDTLVHNRLADLGLHR